MAGNWFDDNGYGGIGDPYDEGGYTNQTLGAPPPIVNAPVLPAEAVPVSTPNPIENVGHDGRTSAGLNREEWRDKWMSSGPMSMDQFKQWLAQNGGELLSDNGTVRTPFGEVLDIGANARTGTVTPAWTIPGGGGGDTSSAGGGMTLGGLGATPSLSGGPMAGSALPLNTSADRFAFAQPVPETERVAYTPFTLPTRDEALAIDPGFQFGLDQGLGQLGAQASARGSIRDPNYVQGMTKFAIDYGNTHYADAANRLFQAHQANQAGAAGATTSNNATALGAQGQGFGQALSGFNANLGSLGQSQQYGLGLGNLALGHGNLALGNKQADNSYALGQGNLGLARDQFGLQTQGQYWNQAFNNNAQQWDQYYKLAQLGYPQS